MNYSKHFGTILKHQGVPNMSPSAFAKMMNIVYLEGKLEGLKKASVKMQKSQEPKMFEIDVFKVGNQLTELTGNLEPKELLENIIKSG